MGRTSIWLLAGALVCGCGDDAASGPDAAVDASIDAPDYGAPSTTYPAFPVDIPTIQNRGGSVIANLTIVTITWSSDPNASTYEAFADALGASRYWMLLNSEFGVGPTSSTAADHVRLTTTPPTSLSNNSIQNLITQNATNSTSGWPAPTASTVYVVYTAPATTFVSNGQNACGQFTGYHSELTINNTAVPYGVVLGCTPVLSGTSTAAGLLDNVATDPLPRTMPAFVGFDDDHFAWELRTGFSEEVSLACQINAGSFYTSAEPGFPYAVQRCWSNASAHAGHSPCVPAPPGAYFSVTALAPETITVDLSSLGQGMRGTHGFKAQIGQPRIFQVGFYSDAATNPFMIAATVPPMLLNDGSGNPLANGTAMVSIDKTSGKNGEKAYVTVTPTSFNVMGVIYLEITSSLGTGGLHNVTPILIGM